MSTELTRLTFTVTKEMEPLLDRAKKELFYNSTQSGMIRELIRAGLEAYEGEMEKGARKGKEN
mgnify:CR=1 FL=1